LLTALDLGLTVRRRLEGLVSGGDLARSSRAGDVAGPRISGGNAAGFVRRSITPVALAALDSLDPALERLFGADCGWGANMVAIAKARA